MVLNFFTPKTHAFWSPVFGVSCNLRLEHKETPVHDTTLSLFSKNLLDLTDLFLNFAGYLFTGAFGFQLWIIV
jgi:hypothetical protein